MSLCKCHGILIRTFNFGEADKIASFYTDEGKLRLIARGARKPRSRFASALEPLNYGQVVYFERSSSNLHSLSSFDVIDRFERIKGDLDRFSSASMALELIDIVSVEGMSDREGFRLFTEYLNLIEDSSEPDLVTYAFALKFLSHSGFRPQLERCVSCLSPIKGTPWFNALSGGVLCARCAARSPGQRFVITRGALEMMRKMLNGDISRSTRFRANRTCKGEIRRAITSFIQSQTERELKSLRFIESMERVVQ
ncbi:TPA: DNA repair protein RecO [Candidatus Poribacteria bacterium]|nr:DNA repair protein RecO [Candidatus Poribacteria bacterium]HEX30698.1 DNA repair protein RecO [Candidatus Poribacteria bacterium]